MSIDIVLLQAGRDSLSDDRASPQTDSERKPIGIASLRADSERMSVDIAPLQADSEPMLVDNAPLQADIDRMSVDIAPLRAGSESMPVDNAPLQADIDRMSIEGDPRQVDLHRISIDHAPLQADMQPMSVDIARRRAGNDPKVVDFGPAQIALFRCQVTPACCGEEVAFGCCSDLPPTQGGHTGCLTASCGPPLRKSVPSCHPEPGGDQVSAELPWTDPLTVYIGRCGKYPKSMCLPQGRMSCGT